MFYIDQLPTPSFPIGLVKTESGFILRSVETGLGRWMLVVAVISVDAYPYFRFLRPDLSPWGYWNSCRNTRIGCTVPPPSKEIKLGSSNQEASPSPGKNTGVVLVPCLCMELRPYSFFLWWGYFWSPWVSFVTTGEFSVRVTKITSRIGVSWTPVQTAASHWSLPTIWVSWSVKIDADFLKWPSIINV